MYINEFKGKFRCYEPTKHYLYNRNERKERLLNTLPKGHLIKSFYVDKGHPKGAEIHHVFSNGVVVVVNAHTKYLVTKLIARPMQVYRYYKACGIEPHMELLGTCYYNTVILKLNY